TTTAWCTWRTDRGPDPLAVTFLRRGVSTRYVTRRKENDDENPRRRGERSDRRLPRPAVERARTRRDRHVPVAGRRSTRSRPRREGGGARRARPERSAHGRVRSRARGDRPSGDGAGERPLLEEPGPHVRADQPDSN